MKKLSIISATLFSTILGLATACGGAEDDFALDIAQREQAVRREYNLFATYTFGEGNLRGVGTASCSGSETSRWGDASRGGYSYVSCTMWYLSEWGPGFFTDEAGQCDNGVVVSDASDQSWSLLP